MLAKRQGCACCLDAERYLAASLCMDDYLSITAAGQLARLSNQLAVQLQQHEFCLQHP
jgi:hypothetical protein